MKTARQAGSVAVAVCLCSFGAAADEGSPYRGLKLPSDALDADAVAYGIGLRSPGVSENPTAALPEFAPRILFSGDVMSQRFTSGRYDYSYALHRPVGHDLPALAAPGAHELVPRYTLYSQVTQHLPGGVGVGLGLRQSEYSFSTSNLLALSAERNFGNFRGAYTLYSNRMDGTSLGSAHRFEVNYLYGERNTIGFSYTTGRDMDNTLTYAGAAYGDVKDWTLSGRHWLSPNWALTYDVLSGDSGNIYRRQGLRLGVSRSF